MGKAKFGIREPCCFLDWNSGTDSPLDMYLMSQCRYGIMANSTFSYWGARLGRKKKQNLLSRKMVEPWYRTT